MIGDLHISTATAPDALDRRQRSAIPSWITPELLEKARRVWSQRRGRILTEAEALADILNVGNLFDALEAVR
jgi:hypothetical protein